MTHTAETLTLGTEYLTRCAEVLGVDRLTVAITEPEAPMPFAVYDPESGDILGAGESPDEAAERAWETVRGWK